MTVDLLTVDCVTDWMLNFGGDLETKSDRGDHVINEARTYVYWPGQITVTGCTNYSVTTLTVETILE